MRITVCPRHVLSGLLPVLCACLLNLLCVFCALHGVVSAAVRVCRKRETLQQQQGLLLGDL